MPETTKLHPKQPVAAALASRAAVRPALRQGGAFALGLAGGWAVLYGALLPFGLGLTLGLPADCFAACAAGAALSILFHGFGAFSLDSLCLLCAVGAAVAAQMALARQAPPGISGRVRGAGAGRCLLCAGARRGRLHAGVLLRGRSPCWRAASAMHCSASHPKSPALAPAGRFCRGGGAGRVCASALSASG